MVSPKYGDGRDILGFYHFFWRSPLKVVREGFKKKSQNWAFGWTTSGAPLSSDFFIVLFKSILLQTSKIEPQYGTQYGTQYWTQYWTQLLNPILYPNIEPNIECKIKPNINPIFNPIFNQSLDAILNPILKQNIESNFEPDI